MGWFRRNWFKLVFFKIILLCWEFFVDSFIIPTPSEILTQFFFLLSKIRTWENIIASMEKVYFSLAIAVVAGLIIGALRYFNPKVSEYVDSIFYPSQFIASAVWTLIAIVLFGLSWITPYFIIVMVILPNMFVAVQVGLKNVNKQLLEFGQSITHSKWRLFRFIIFPQVMPPFFMGIIRSNAIAWKVVVTAEIFIGTNGLGFMVNNYYRLINMPKLFATVFLIILIGLGMDFILRYIHRRFLNYDTN